MLTSWNTQCGIAEYSRALVEALRAREDVELVVLGSRNYDERSVGRHEDYVVACFDVEQWNRYGAHELDVERILDLGLDVLHVQYQLGLYDIPRLVELLERFGGATVITWHDNWVPPELLSRAFEASITHRLGVGPADVVIPFGVRRLPAVVRTFGLGRSRAEVIAPICERNGWTFESAATSETPFGGQHWRPWRELHEWLRGADAIVLWYADDAMMGSSQAAHTAIATRRPVVVTDTTWFADLPHRPGILHKIADDPAALEATLRDLLSTDELIDDAAWELVAERHVDCYRQALASIDRRASPQPSAAAAAASPATGDSHSAAAGSTATGDLHAAGASGSTASQSAGAAGPNAAATAALEPLSAAAVDRWMAGDAGHLHRAHDLTRVPLATPRRLGRRTGAALRRNVRRLLFPLLEAQTSLNAANARVVTFLLRHLAAQSRSVAELERKLAELREAPATALGAGERDEPRPPTD
jgi:hypothetical protein